MFPNDNKINYNLIWIEISLGSLTRINYFVRVDENHDGRLNELFRFSCCFLADRSGSSPITLGCIQNSEIPRCELITRERLIRKLEQLSLPGIFSPDAAISVNIQRSIGEAPVI